MTTAAEIRAKLGKRQVIRHVHEYSEDSLNAIQQFGVGLVRAEALLKELREEIERGQALLEKLRKRKADHERGNSSSGE
jgi:hypothetical protein